jgi:predicted metal-dependent HD superfamily phosphohydrolase
MLGVVAGDDHELAAAWHHIAGSSLAAERVLASLVARHRQPHRRYHGTRHVVWMLRHVRELAAALGGPVDLDVAMAAAFFHDAIYDPRRDDNEVRSAELAVRELSSLANPAWPAARVIRVGELVGATAHTAGIDGAVDDADGTAGDVEGVAGRVDVERAVVLDADLAVLGSDPRAYQAYVDGVRGEYAHLDAATWRTGRAGVLRDLLARPTLYRTEPARARWERRARANLTAELASLM